MCVFLHLYVYIYIYCIYIYTLYIYIYDANYSLLELSDWVNTPSQIQLVYQ